MESLGKLLLLVGVLIAAVGLVLMVAPRIPWLGKLPGDIAIEKEHFRLYIPITTSLLLSAILSLLLWAISHLRK
jgi:hypothetical protein